MRKVLAPTFFDDVGLFHIKFGLPNVLQSDEKAHLLDDSTFEFRYKFMQEELQEMAVAHLEGDLCKFADALADLVYVTLGTAHMAHIPFDRVWDEVQRANMTKVRATSAQDERSTRKHHFDVVKPDGWQPPDIEGALE